MRSILILFASLCLTFSVPHSAKADEGWILGDNFYEVDAGKYYRSAQLSAASFEKYISQYKIQTVINLRGENPGEPWYQDEAEVMHRLNVNFINIPMSADRLPHKKDLITLLDAFKNAPRPILVHCQAGADRTGEASAIYQMIFMGKAKPDAIKMLSLKYGHIASLKPAKDYFVRDVWQGIDWAYQSYNPCVTKYQYYDQNDPVCRQ